MSSDFRPALYRSAHALKSTAPDLFGDLLRQLGDWETREIMACVSADHAVVQKNQGRAQIMHEVVQILLECSSKTRQLEIQEMTHGNRPATVG